MRKPGSRIERGYPGPNSAFLLPRRRHRDRTRKREYSHRQSADLVARHPRHLDEHCNNERQGWPTSAPVAKLTCLRHPNWASLYARRLTLAIEAWAQKRNKQKGRQKSPGKTEPAVNLPRLSFIQPSQPLLECDPNFLASAAVVVMPITPSSHGNDHNHAA
jgi:hypothetical protein